MTNWRKVFSLPALGAVDPMNIHKVLGVGSSTVAAWYAGYTSAGDLVDIMGGGASKLLADTNSPTISQSKLQGADGNKLQAFTYVSASSQAHSVAFNSEFNISSANHTLVVVCSSTLDREVMAFPANGAEAAAAGFRLTNANSATYYSAVSSETVTGPLASSPTDGYFHVIHLVCSGRIARMFIDGASGTPVDITGFGIDATTGSIKFGSGISGSMSGNIVYARMHNAAMTDAQIQREFMMWAGAGLGTTWGPSLDFARAGTAYQTFSDGTMALQPAGMPRVGDGVLVEGAATQLFTYTGAFSTNWTKTRSSIAGTSVILPDGTTGTTNTLHEDGTAANNHILAHAQHTVVSGTSNCYSIYVKYNGSAATPREWVRLYIDDTALANSVFFNIRYGYVGTVSKSFASGSHGIEPKTNGWYRIYVWGTSTQDSALANTNLAIAEADNDITFDGADQDSVFIAFPQLETGSFPTSYVPRAAATAASRVADDLSIPTYRLRNTLKDVITTAPTMWLDFTQDPSGATITDNSTSYTLTKAGQPKRYTSPVYGDYHLFDGSSDNYTNATIGNPAGDFSVSVVFTPSTVAAGVGVIASKWYTSGNQRGWTLYRNSASVVFSRSTDGAAGTVLAATKSSALVAGKPCLITATYSTTGGLNVYVDALTVASQAATGAVHPSTANFAIATDIDANSVAGRLHYLAYYNGTALTQANHDAMYAALKLPGILPISIAHDTHYTKLRIKGEYKHVGLATLGTATAQILDIGGNVGSADSDTNRISIRMYSNEFYASIYADGESTQRYMSIGTVTQNSWNSFDVVFDLGNLANSTGSIYKGLSTTGTSLNLNASMTGSDKHLSLLDTDIRVGKDYANTAAAYANAHIRNLEIMIA